MNKVDARTAFKTIRNASHGANIQAVLAKQLDVATNNTEEIDKLEATKPEVAKELKVIWKSPLIPNDPLVWRKDLDAGVKAKLKGFLLSYGQTDADRAVLKNIYNYSGFKESSNEQLVPIRQLELFKDRRKVENDEQYSADEKAQRIAEIDKKLAALNK
jgi:phosphonate transport system substrate-binding protein